MSWSGLEEQRAVWHNDDKFVLFSSVDPEFRAAAAHSSLQPSLLLPRVFITVGSDMQIQEQHNGLYLQVIYVKPEAGVGFQIK